jgi:sugar phosphate isomerase/epimerase
MPLQILADGHRLLARGDAVTVGREYKKLADDKGFSFPQGHLWLRADITSGVETLDILKNWLDLFLTLGIRSAVLHTGGDNTLPDEVLLEKRVRALEVLTGYIKGSPLTICLENLRGRKLAQTADDLNAMIDAVGDENLGICLDTGHLNYCSAIGCGQPQGEFIRKAGKRLKALHIDDNDGTADQHRMPYRGTVDWQDVMSALAEVGYDRLFNLEIPGESLGTLDEVSERLRSVRKLCDDLLTMA